MTPAANPFQGLWLLLPFVLLLLAIAVMPFVAAHWWERHYAKVSLILGGFVAAYYLIVLQAVHRVGDALHEYGSFIILMAALFIVAGGIHIRVRGGARPDRKSVG